MELAGVFSPPDLALVKSLYKCVISVIVKARPIIR